MPRQRKDRPSSGQQRSTTDQCLVYLRSSLNELRTLMSAMEQGNSLSARTVATVVYRILADELPIAARRRKIRLYSGIFDPEGSRAPFPLTVYEVSPQGTRIAPILVDDVARRRAVNSQKWKTEIVFWGKEVSQLFQDPELSIPEVNLTREKFVKDVRNETGAHLDEDISIFSALSSSGYVPFDFKVVKNGGDTGAAPKLHNWDYLSATVVAIAFELLMSLRVIEHEGQLLLVNTIE